MNSDLKIKEIKELAMSDRLFEPESISLESFGKSLTVRQNPLQEKHFNIRNRVEVPLWNDFEDMESCAKYIQDVI